MSTFHSSNNIESLHTMGDKHDLIATQHLCHEKAANQICALEIREARNQRLSIHHAISDAPHAVPGSSAWSSFSFSFPSPMSSCCCGSMPLHPKKKKSPQLCFLLWFPHSCATLKKQLSHLTWDMTCACTKLSKLPPYPPTPSTKAF